MFPRTAHRVRCSLLLHISLKAMFIDPTGRLVNYRRLRANTVYHDLCEMSNRLATISLENVTENERKTFFISKTLPLPFVDNGEIERYFY